MRPGPIRGAGAGETGPDGPKDFERLVGSRLTRKGPSAELALARKLPCCGYVKEVLEAGVLISYGADQRLIARRTAYFVDRILKGEKPAEMPVEQPTGFQLCINLTTAKALGLSIPPTLLASADDVVE